MSYTGFVKLAPTTLELPVERMLVLNLVHVTPGVAKLLEENDTDHLVCYPYKYGWKVLTNLNDLDMEALPESLAHCLKLASASRCKWLVLDQDAEEVDFMPTYEW